MLYSHIRQVAFKQFRPAAVYVDKILKVASAANLPIGRPTKYELKIDLKRTKDLAITVPEASCCQLTKLFGYNWRKGDTGVEG
jgi:hypothetical protein